MVKSLLNEFIKNNPNRYHGENPWLEDLRLLENQERAERGILGKRHDLEFGLGAEDHLNIFLGQHEKQEREIQRSERTLSRARIIKVER